MTILADDAAESAIVRGLVANWCENRRSLAADPQVHIIDTPDLFWFSCDVPRGWYNAVLVARFTPAEAEARITEVCVSFVARGRPWLWFITPDSAPTDLGTRLLARGLTHSWDVTNMALNLRDADLRLASLRDVALHTVTDEATLALWAEQMRRENADGDPLHDRVNALALASAVSPSKVHVVATLAGEPVARATILLAHGVAGLYGVETLPQARGRGIGSAVTVAALAHARAAGYEVAVLQASPMGYGVYQRLGFRDVSPFATYAWQPAR